MARNTAPTAYDSGVMFMPVDGSVCKESIPYVLKKDKDDRLLAGKYLINPCTPTLQLLAEGQLLYDRTCQLCHGAKGDGDGFLHTSGKFAYPPAKLNTVKVRNIPDGEIYHVITVGYNLMQPVGNILTPEDRWKVVLYVKNGFGR